ncbi:hypothetical protein E1301_Tti002142 [Triplophysa tibetana]|uniref:Uncharacterized protein n=1 Tax=Triplophysa tibetana TaxID=1572043 RepID=A0A5A9N9Z6_9TELE|nr:hypothetical protein E1301_Tti002142 [Triplophysa tibetana]
MRLLPRSAACAKVGREKVLVVRRVKWRPLYVLFLQPQPRGREYLVAARFWVSLRQLTALYARMRICSSCRHDPCLPSRSIRRSSHWPAALFCTCKRVHLTPEPMPWIPPFLVH